MRPTRSSWPDGWSADADGVLALRREQHRRTPIFATYALLQAAARAQDIWDVERSEARHVLASSNLRALIDALLADGDIDEAWSLATAGDGTPDGSQWKRLAEAREPTDPSGALDVYLRLADDALVVTGKGAYREAVRHLTAAHRAATAAGRLADLGTRITDLRQQHRRRPTLIAMLDKAGLR